MSGKKCFSGNGHSGIFLVEKSLSRKGYIEEMDSQESVRQRFQVTALQNPDNTPPGMTALDKRIKYTIFYYLFLFKLFFIINYNFYWLRYVSPKEWSNKHFAETFSLKMLGKLMINL
jgi:hypothetical protein